MPPGASPAEKDSRVMTNQIKKEVGKDHMGSQKSLRAEKEGGLESYWGSNFCDIFLEKALC